MAARITLGIESSCDEMAAAVVRDGREIMASVVEGQEGVHAPYGGVVPELASRDHVRAVSEVVEAALLRAATQPRELAGVAVTAGPGLVGSLLVGLSFAKALAYRFELPLVGVHHLEGHLASAELGDPELRPPYVGLVISGGHTALYRVEPESADAATGAQRAPVLLGETRDDAVGEAFDKVAKLLGLPYPGGPSVAAAAEAGNPEAVDFPRPMTSQPGLAFSYSGLKTAVALELERRRASGPLHAADIADVAASFQSAATDVLIIKARRALRAEGMGQLAVVGGVAANRRLRAAMAQAAAADGFRAVFAPLEFCTDNAAMIAAVGDRLLQAGVRDPWSLNAFSRARIGEEPWRAAAARDPA